MTVASALPYTYDTAEIPAATGRGGKVAGPNPHKDAVLNLYALATEGTFEARSFHISADGLSEKQLQTAVTREKALLGDVGRDNTPKFSVRTTSKVSSTTVGKKTIPTELVTFWINFREENGVKVPALITRTRKS